METIHYTCWWRGNLLEREQHPTFFQRLFNDDIKDKKLLARSAAYRLSRRAGTTGKKSVRLPCDLLDRSTKKLYTQPQNERSYLWGMERFEDYKQLSDVQKQRVMMELCRRFPNDNELASYWHIPLAQARSERKKAGVLRKRNGAPYLRHNDTARQQAGTAVPRPVMTMKLEGTFQGDNLGERLTALVNLLNGQARYRLQCSVEEIASTPPDREQETPTRPDFQ